MASELNKHLQVEGLAEEHIIRLRAFPTPSGGGNPAGVVLACPQDALSPAIMQVTAARVGYSETAFLVDGPAETGRRDYRVRYFSPDGEVPFCGHATIAAGVALAQRVGAGDYFFETEAGPITVSTTLGHAGASATFTSAPPASRAVNPAALNSALTALHLQQNDLSTSIPPAEAFAGAWHLILPVRERHTLTRIDGYSFDGLRKLSLENEWVTVHLAFAESPTMHHVRAPFPYGGVVEDPATGAGAAAYVCYLRSLGAVTAPATVTILQGEDMGQPCQLKVTIDADGPAEVSGTAWPA